jgi:PhnB protein
MTIQAATPYLTLNGKAEEAIALYQRALRATTEDLKRFGDMDANCPEATRNQVMHAVLRVGKALLMLSDGSPVKATPSNSAVSVALDFDDADELRRSFDGLSASGKIIQPVMDAPWGAVFGMVEDKFGIVWMVNCAKKPS